MAKKIRFESAADLKAWADRLEFINALTPSDYANFQTLYARIMFFENLFEHLDQLHRNLKQATFCYDALKNMIDSGDLKRAVELSNAITKIIGEDD